jgi:hypothetical protein
LTDPRERIQQGKEDLKMIKEEAEKASEERMGRWWEEESERRKQLARVQTRRRDRERIMLIGVITVVLIVLLAILGYVLWTSIGPGAANGTPTAIPW